ncbi:efflux RND transporter periplasmic adaptor subunit [Curvibacter delicatus]|jgi:RND family efflux transporter MFP subunit|uniref:efflux RND transporter periplasmic adaptor subunit n=1 Tax=Curvibacter delicatus TaxID=80879 RepID=UPI000A018C1C|nr:efflux RND transporter periplasmic adaptor subunit [Curvibacter delicatus]
MLFPPRLSRTTLGVASLLVVLAGPVVAQDATKPIPWNKKLEAGAGVSTVQVQAQTGGGGAVLLQGTVVLPAQQSDVVSMPVAGVVQSVLVAPMQTVRAGQPVARIMSPELAQWQREWLMADTQARLAQGKAQRDEQMFADGIVSEHRRNESRAQAEMATLAARERRQALRLAGVGEAALAQASKNAGLSPQLTLVAPVAGTVLEQMATPGQRLEAGSLVAHIARAGQLAIELQASREQAQALRVGDALQVDGCKTPAHITALSPQLSSTTQGVQLRAELTGREDCLRINQFVHLRWQGTAVSAAGVFSVPTAAVVQQGGRHYVFVRQPQGFRAVVVTMGPGGGSEVLITSGLKAGDEVAVKGVAAIKGAWLGLGADAGAGQ